MRARKLFVGFLALFAVVGLWGVPAGAAEHESEEAQHEDESASGEEEGGHGAYSSHEAEECVHILEEGGTVEQCQEAPNPILPATNEIIWGGLAFIILFGLLAKLGLPAIQKGMQDRTAQIQGDLDAAAAAKAEQQAVLDRYNAQLQEARQSADAVRRDLTQRAEAEAAELRQRNAEQLTAERERLMGEVQSQVATLAIELAERVVEGNLDRDAQLRLIDSYIANVGSGSR